MADDLQTENPYAAPLDNQLLATQGHPLTWRSRIAYGLVCMIGAWSMTAAIREWTNTEPHPMPIGGPPGVLDFVWGILLVLGALLRFAGNRAGKWIVVTSFTLLFLYGLSIVVALLIVGP